ncbi:LOB domain-containing protein 18-like [Salvia hispanica]|uniref:LOB domain-containing protein 18-like n=1 Tax=Salvia hispanica TaxID=49212 RepID=UPI0020095FAD|nr:LOB domain-containing protein 18-like [Salvia hispanica]
MSSGNVAGSGSAAAAGGGGPCGACKFLRRKCVPECVFAPYFDSEQGAAHFAAVHKVFGASNVSKLLLHIPESRRLDTVITVCYEAQSRLRDPIHGCVAHIFNLQQQVVNLQQELSYLQAHIAAMHLPAPPPLQQQQQLLVPVSPAILDFSPIPVAYDLSTVVAPQSSWSLYPRQQIEPQRQFSNTASQAAVGVGGGCDLQEMARELLNRHAPPMVGCSNQTSSLPPKSC